MPCRPALTEEDRARRLTDAHYKHRLIKREQGLCGRDGCWAQAAPGQYHCPTHFASHAAERKERRQKARARAVA